MVLAEETKFSSRAGGVSAESSGSGRQRGMRDRKKGESDGLSPFRLLDPFVLLDHDFGDLSIQLGGWVGDVLQHAIDGALCRVVVQVQDAGGLADGLAKLEAVRNLSVCSEDE